MALLSLPSSTPPASAPHDNKRGSPSDAGKPGRAGAAAGRQIGHAHRSWPAAARPGPPGRSAHPAAGRAGRRAASRPPPHRRPARGSTPTLLQVSAGQARSSTARSAMNTSCQVHPGHPADPQHRAQLATAGKDPPLQVHQNRTLRAAASHHHTARTSATTSTGPLRPDWRPVPAARALATHRRPPLEGLDQRICCNAGASSSAPIQERSPNLLVRHRWVLC
jgi:hypothetical protein